MRFSKIVVKSMGITQHHSSRVGIYARFSLQLHLLRMPTISHLEKKPGFFVL